MERDDIVKTLRTLPRSSSTRLRTALTLLETKQMDLAQATQIDDTKLSKVLNGYRTFSDDERTRVAEYLRLPVAVLFPEAA